MAKGKFVRMDGSAVKPCTCKSDVQDKLYGKGLRLHTVTTKGFRCTVCGKDKLV
jgi:hypothetical protein